MRGISKPAICSLLLNMQPHADTKWWFHIKNPNLWLSAATQSKTNSVFCPPVLILAQTVYHPRAEVAIETHSATLTKYLNEILRICPVSHLTNSLMVYLHLLQPLCQCLILCDGGAEW